MTVRSGNTVFSIIAVLLFILLFLSPAADGEPLKKLTGKVHSQKGYAGLAAKIKERGSVRLIVRVEASFKPMSAAASPAANQQAAGIAAAQNALLSELKAFNPRKVRQYRHIPYIFMEADGNLLDALLASRRVHSLYEDIPYPAMLDLSVPRIGASSLWSSTYDGTGTAVAVLDTGVDKTHPFLSGAVVSEACYSTNDVNIQARSLCPGDVESSTEPDSAMPYLNGACDTGECDHGTHVSGIVAGRQNVQDSPGPGVAPGAGIIAIQIFTRIDSAAECGGTAPCFLAYTSDIISGLERVYALSSDPVFSSAYSIASANMSLGGGQYFSNCDVAESPTKAAIDNLRAAGVSTVVSAGNEYACGSLSYPACISSAVSVGATDDADAVAGYSNSASFLSLLAPGSAISSSVPGAAYQSWNGTSMAAPHVAGAWALLKDASTGAGVEQVLNALTATGLPVTDSKCGSVTKKRINVGEASAFMQGGAAYAQTDAATDITTTGATLNATINANNSDTAVTFEYGMTPSYGNTVSAVGPVTGTANTVVSVALTGLLPNTFYHFRVKAVNAGGITTYGSDMTFGTDGLCGSLLDGSFEGGTPNSSWAEHSTNFGTPLCDIHSCGFAGALSGFWWAWFGGVDWGDELGYLDQTVSLPAFAWPRLEFYVWNGASSGNGEDSLKVLVDGSVVFSLSEGDPLYAGGYVRTGVDLSGYADGASHTIRFSSTTTGLPTYTSFFLDDISLSCVRGAFPVLETGAVSAGLNCSSTLNGMAYAYGMSTSVAFDYGTSTNYGSTVAADQSPVAATAGISVSAGLSGLLPWTTYHYRLKGESSAGISYGRDMAFSTFSLSPEIRIGGANYGQDIETAVSAANPDDLIRANSYSFAGNPVFSGSGIVTFSGGFDCAFLHDDSFTTVLGSVTFGGSRTVLIKNIIIQ